MPDRVKFLIQKRVALKAQLTNLEKFLDKGDVDSAILKLRIARVTELYRAFEEHNDELAVLDSNDAHAGAFDEIQERFYTLAGRVENILSASTLSDASTSASSTGSRNVTAEGSVSRRHIKLPEAPLPTFDGKYENWLVFKNSFQGIIGSQPDLTDMDKLHYLKAALVEGAADKIKIFAVNDVSYFKAWDLLEKSYEVKRVLVSRHLSFILNMPHLEKESASGLTKLADEMQQHVTLLDSLGVTVSPDMIVHLLESKLPKITADKWEATLNRDELPAVEKMYEFIYKTAVCASKRDRSKTVETERQKEEVPFKKFRRGPANQALLLNTARSCIACKTHRHPLYLCGAFKALSVQKRIDIVKRGRLCYNCLKSHRDRPCQSSGCTICQKRHNTLLHLENLTHNRAVAKVETVHTQTA